VLRTALDAVRTRLTGERRRFVALVTKLEAMSPLAVMARGYAVAFQADGHVLRSAAQVKPGDSFTLRLSPSTQAQSLEACDEIDATVTGVKPA
jgi:exodeoxyribonuclease VII large subunit